MALAISAFAQQPAPGSAAAPPPAGPSAPAPASDRVAPIQGKFEWARLQPLPTEWYDGSTLLTTVGGRRLLAVHTDIGGGAEKRLEAANCGAAPWAASTVAEPSLSQLRQPTTSSGDRFLVDESGMVLSREPPGGAAVPVPFANRGILRVGAGGPWLVVRDGNAILRTQRLSLSRDGGQTWTSTERFADREVIVAADAAGVFVLDREKLYLTRDGASWSVANTIGLEFAPSFGQLVNCEGMLVLMSEELELWSTFTPSP